MSAGYVSLVGAGPGDPDLLTVKAVRRLNEADLVLYDALVPPEVLALASHAPCFCVGKRAGGRGVRQEHINRLLVSMARRGKHVVRLKCGDPFVLGRGGEAAGVHVDRPAGGTAGAVSRVHPPGCRDDRDRPGCRRRRVTRIRREAIRFYCRGAPALRLFLISSSRRRSLSEPAPAWRKRTIPSPSRT